MYLLRGRPLFEEYVVTKVKSGTKQIIYLWGEIGRENTSMYIVGDATKISPFAHLYGRPPCVVPDLALSLSLQTCFTAASGISIKAPSQPPQLGEICQPPEVIRSST